MWTFGCLEPSLIEFPQSTSTSPMWYKSLSSFWTRDPKVREPAPQWTLGEFSDTLRIQCTVLHQLQPRIPEFPQCRPAADCSLVKDTSLAPTCSQATPDILMPLHDPPSGKLSTTGCCLLSRLPLLRRSGGILTFWFYLPATETNPGHLLVQFLKVNIFLHPL